MPLTEEELSDHLLNCSSCREDRENINNLVQEHMLHDLNSCSERHDHLQTCHKCRTKILTLYKIIAFHIMVNKFKKKVKRFFGLKN